MKAFDTKKAAMLGIGSMVGAGIFVVIGQAGSIAGNIVWLSFVLGGLVALLSGYSLAKLAIRFPSRGGIVEYLVQGYGEGVFSGAMSVMFYFAQLVAVAAVAKGFGEYGARLMGYHNDYVINLYAVLIILIFMGINLIGASVVAKSESLIVGIKIFILVVFTIVALFTINPVYLSIKDMPPMNDMLFAIGLTFFAYQGFSVITNTVEDMQNPSKTMLKAMFFAIVFVMVLYVGTSLAVLGNLSLSEVIKAKDYALAQAAYPVFGDVGFKIMAITALLATASAINATLYSVAEIGYTLAKDGELPKIYEYNVFNSTEGLIVSSVLIIPMVIFFNLSQITIVATMVVLLVQSLVYLGHLKIISKTKANFLVVLLAFLGMFGVIVLTLVYSYQNNNYTIMYVGVVVIISFLAEGGFRRFKNRTISKKCIINKG